ncbi:transglutaminase-like domain-containing protein [Sphingomonas sp. H39-1-10]|uniref:SirB1 family protein n=1 Tax=Sphingomonas pollutisoli TaxID=3030829 RepID=UPI0023B9701B|nr:transglutaminase-like domain-containing protein [Sphingomonas pollutisoli]MDF0486535.1 transglutaminase-like domain-containing protein [Sphingomonas pollutisoli]
MLEDVIRLGLVDEDEIVLDEAALSLARLDHPDVDEGPYHRLLEAVAVRLETIGEGAATAHERAAALSSVLADAFGFAGDETTYDDPANADLIRVIDRRRGLPVSLSILYVSAARRLGWAANVLDVPGHVLVLVGDESAPVIVDPFRGGALVEPEDLGALLMAASPGPSPAVRQVAAMPNRAVLVRLLLNQAIRAERSGKGRRALELYTRMTMMAPDHGPAWWERARLEGIDGDVAAARNSLTSLLEVTRDPELRARVAETLTALVAP